MGGRKVRSAIQNLIDSGYIRTLIEEVVKKQLAQRRLDHVEQVTPPSPLPAPEKKTPPTRRRSPRQRSTQEEVPREVPAREDPPVILSDDSEVVFYGCNARVEYQREGMMLVSTYEDGPVLQEVRDGVVVSACSLSAPPVSVGVTNDRVAVVMKGHKGFLTQLTTLPLINATSRSFPVLASVSPTLRVSCAQDVVYCADVVDEGYDLMTLRTRCPGGRHVVDNDTSFFIFTVTRLRRVLKSKESGIATWEHLLLTDSVTHTAATETHVVYSHGPKLVVVCASTGEGSEVRFKRSVQSVALGSSVCYALTEDGLLHTIHYGGCNVLSSTALDEYMKSSTLYLQGSHLFYSTGYSIRRFTLH